MPQIWPLDHNTNLTTESFHPRALFQYSIRRLIVRSREVSRPRDLYSELSDRSEIWQAPRQHCCRCAFQISRRCDDYKSRGFETSWDLTIRHLIGYCNGAQVSFCAIAYYIDIFELWIYLAISHWIGGLMYMSYYGQLCVLHFLETKVAIYMSAMPVMYHMFYWCIITSNIIFIYFLFCCTLCTPVQIYLLYV